MPIQTLYLKHPPRRVRLALQAIVGSSTDMRFELISAEGGTVVALIYGEEKVGWAPQALTQGRVQKRIETMFRQLADELAGSGSGGVTDVAPA